METELIYAGPECVSCVTRLLLSLQQSKTAHNELISTHYTALPSASK